MEGPATDPAAAPGEALARFMERRGHPVLRALGVPWWRRARYVYMSLPHERRLDLDPQEVAEVLRERRIAGLRYPTCSGMGEPGGLYMCRTAGYSHARLTRTRRQEVVKGLAHFELRWVDPDELLAQGYEVGLQTMARHDNFNPEYSEPRRWARFCAAVRASPEVVTAGAFHEGRLSAFVVACRDGAWLHAHLKMGRTEHLRLHSSSALDVWLLSEAAKDPTLEGVTSGGLSGAEHLLAYKRSVGYELVSLPRVTQLHPALRVLAHRWSARATGALATALPRVRRLRSLATAVAAARSSLPAEVPRLPG